MSIDGLEIGTYYFNILVYDEDLNLANYTVLVNVIAPIAPEWVDQQTNILFEESSTGNTLTWNVTDSFPSNYLLYNNEILVANSTWTSYDTINPSISYNVDGLLYGTHNFTIYIFDTANSFLTNWVLINVTDETSPLITILASPFSYDEISVNNTLTWDVFDNHPNYYIVSVNSSLYDTLFPIQGNWTNTITINIDGFLKGGYNLSIIIFDQHGNNITHSVVITVIDISGPFIEAYHPLEFNELTLGNTLTWSVNDNHSYNYTILLNGVSIQTANWTNAENVTYNIDGFALGTYNFTLYAFDGSGNNASLVTLIEIRDNDSPSFTSVPSIPVYAEGDTGINLHWYPNDKYPFNYTIYQDNIPIQSGNWTNEDSISINIDGLLKGDYNFTLLIFD
ncbi:MAG: hypothetical protein ACXAC2_25795, partial [Candidatus Kariarchaeaceae archaeon]